MKFNNNNNNIQFVKRSGINRLQQQQQSRHPVKQMKQSFRKNFSPPLLLSVNVWWNKFRAFIIPYRYLSPKFISIVKKISRYDCQNKTNEYRSITEIFRRETDKRLVEFVSKFKFMDGLKWQENKTKKSSDRNYLATVTWTNGWEKWISVNFFCCLGNFLIEKINTFFLLFLLLFRFFKGKHDDDHRQQEKNLIMKVNIEFFFVHLV